MILIDTNQKSSIEDWEYNERMLLFEYLGAELLIRRPNLLELANSSGFQARWGMWFKPTYHQSVSSGAGS